MAAQVVNFVILLYILKRFLYGPILKVLNERKNKIAKSLQDVEEIERKLKAVSEEEQRRIAKAVAEGQELMKQTEAALVQMSQEEQARVQKIVEKMLVDGRVQLQQEREKIISDIRKNFVRVFDLIQQKVFGKGLTGEQKQLLQKVIKEMK